MLDKYILFLEFTEHLSNPISSLSFCPSLDHSYFLSLSFFPSDLGLVSTLREAQFRLSDSLSVKNKKKKKTSSNNIHKGSLQKSLFWRFNQGTHIFLIVLGFFFITKFFLDTLFARTTILSKPYYYSFTIVNSFTIVLL